MWFRNKDGSKRWIDDELIINYGYYRNCGIQEAIDKLLAVRTDIPPNRISEQASLFVDRLVALGILKLKEEVSVMYKGGSIDEYVRLEKWPEGYCLWLDGMIVYKSWK